MCKIFPKWGMDPGMELKKLPMPPSRLGLPTMHEAPWSTTSL